MKGFRQHSLRRDGIALTLHVQEGEGPLMSTTGLLASMVVKWRLVRRLRRLSTAMSSAAP